MNFYSWRPGFLVNITQSASQVLQSSQLVMIDFNAYTKTHSQVQFIRVPQEQQIEAIMICKLLVTTV